MSGAELYHETCADLARPTAGLRREALAAPVDPGFHARLVQRFDVLRRMECRPPTRAVDPPGSRMKVTAWNVERGSFLDDCAALLRNARADVNLLSELDLGMARSRQEHTTRKLAERLGQGYVYGVEFVELGLGNETERRRHAGEENAAGLHGAAILSPHPLDRPALIRLEHDGAWFDGARGERRVGGRIAIAARVRLAATPVIVVSVHLESHSDPAHRATQMAALLDALEHYAPGAPVLIAGDFNCKSMSRTAARDPERLAALLAEDPDRLLDPVRHEPLFDVAASAGYDWRACNAAGATTRVRPGDPAGTPLLKLDWIFTRGLIARDPAIVPAVNAAGEAISDHEALTVTVSLEASR